MVAWIFGGLVRTGGGKSDENDEENLWTKFDHVIGKAIFTFANGQCVNHFGAVAGRPCSLSVNLSSPLS